MTTPATGGGARDYARLKAIFTEALTLADAARDEFLERRCAGDPTLRAEADRLLAAAAHRDFLERPALDANHPDLGRGYRIVREIARGGMGIVYLAERDDGEYRSQVAIKVLTAAAALHPDAVARLRQERQILARLNHAHIARLYDGGTTAQGLPYLVMEYVDGERIDVFAHRRALDGAARIELFLKVCDAVSFAHANLIVHRDLKPGNILVSADGGLRLLDFGIAKLLENADAALTEQGSQLMTPRYASPEQLRGEPVTTASDVYALGVVLYELLTGASPYAAATASAPVLARAICETEPAAPSTVRDVAANAPAALAHALRGDLDAIVLKALRKRPQERYASVAELADDLRRHLRREPVHARRGGLSYRAGRFVRRHWLALGAAAALAVLAIVFVVGLAWQLRQTRAERDKAEQVVAFLDDLFRIADPSESRGNTVTVREALDRGAARLNARQAHLPGAVQAALLDVVGRVYEHLGLLAKAEPLLLRARELRATGSAEERNAAAVTLAELRFDQGRFKETSRILLPLASAGASTLPSRLFLLLGQAQLRLGEREAAQASLQRALELARQRHGADSLEVAEVFSAFANLAHDRGDIDASLDYFRRTLAIRERRSDDPWLLAKVRNNLGLLLVDRGDYAAAEPLLRDSLAGIRRVLGNEHPLVATALGNVASVLQRRGHCVEAQPLLEEAYALRLKLFGPDNGLTGIARGNLGYGLLCLGRYAEAAPALAAARASERQALGDDNMYTLAIARNQAALKFASGDLAGAAAQYRGLIERGGDKAATQPLLVQARAQLGRVERYLGDAAAGLRDIDAARALQTRLLPAGHPDRVEVELMHADAVLAAKAMNRAVTACRSASVAAAGLRAALPDDSVERAYATLVLAQCARAGYGSAPESGDRARMNAVLARHFGAAHPLTTAAAATLR